jgi:methyl-accepting chemotaxis protein
LCCFRAQPTVPVETNAADISELTERIVTNIGGNMIDIHDTFHGFSAQSEEFSASCVQVAAAIEEQTASMNQMTYSTLRLTQLADTFSKMVANFNLNT